MQILIKFAWFDSWRYRGSMLNEGIDNQVIGEGFNKGNGAAFFFVKGMGVSAVEVTLEALKSAIFEHRQLQDGYSPYTTESIPEGTLLLYLSILKW